ncbi:hypothetical protein FSP39_001992 [Pinctada imbricata]|uniref:Voltage-gated hydrogen channel 1 n=1 Tax=Pinctada imbricata TaxID=66713 RepID=A0AA89C4U6_PINIB|nr:hypothetical protein FSP39_001992 [Pinctada imbricata]
MIDCALVLGKLVLDLHHVKEIMTTKEDMALEFQNKLGQKYPDRFTVFGADRLQHTYETVLTSHMVFNGTDTLSSGSNMTNDLKTVDTNYKRSVPVRNLEISGISEPNLESTHHRRNKRASNSADPSSSPSDAKEQTTEEILAIACHKLSIIIVCTLFTETILKVGCFGHHFFSNKLEVFDAVIVVASFVVDFVFLNMSVNSIQQFILILACMLPWGVIRVVNSLVVAVRDHEHFRLKLLYTQKKKTDSENKHLKQERDKLNEQVDGMRKLCVSEGIEEWKVSQCLARQVMKQSKGIMGSFASLALGAIGGGKSNGASLWNLLGTPKMRRGRSEEWEGKLGVNKDKEETKSLRYTEKVWTMGTSETKKHKHSKSLTYQNTVESDPGTPTVIRGKIKALKRFLKRQDPVDSGSFSSVDTVEKDSKCSLDKMTTSDISSPPQSFDYESMDEAENRGTMPVCDIINECSPEQSLLGDDTASKSNCQSNKGSICVEENVGNEMFVNDDAESEETELLLPKKEKEIYRNGKTVLDNYTAEVSVHRVSSETCVHRKLSKSSMDGIIMAANTSQDFSNTKVNRHSLGAIEQLVAPETVVQSRSLCDASPDVTVALISITDSSGFGDHEDTRETSRVSTTDTQKTSDLLTIETEIKVNNKNCSSKNYTDVQNKYERTAALIELNGDLKRNNEKLILPHIHSGKGRSLSLQLPNLHRVNDCVLSKEMTGIKPDFRHCSKTTDDLISSSTYGRSHSDHIKIDGKSAV